MLLCVRRNDVPVKLTYGSFVRPMCVHTLNIAPNVYGSCAPCIWAGERQRDGGKLGAERAGAVLAVSPPLSRSHPSSSPASIASALSAPRSGAGHASTRRQRRPSGLSAQPGGCAEIRRRVFRTSREMSVRGSGCGYRGWRRTGRGLRDAPVSVDPQRGAGVGKMGAFYSPFANRRTGNALVELGQCCGGIGHRPPRTPDSQDARGDARRQAAGVGRAIRCEGYLQRN